MQAVQSGDDPLDLVIDGGEHQNSDQKDQEAALPYNLEFNLSLKDPLNCSLVASAQRADIASPANVQNREPTRLAHNNRKREKRHTVIGYYPEPEMPPSNSQNIMDDHHVASLRFQGKQTTGSIPNAYGKGSPGATAHPGTGDREVKIVKPGIPARQPSAAGAKQRSTSRSQSKGEPSGAT